MARFLAALVAILVAPAAAHAQDVQTVARGIIAGEAWSLRASVERRPAPTPIEPGRSARVGCVDLAVGTGPSGGEDAVCADDRPAPPLAYTTVEGCNGVGTAIVMLLAPGVRVAAVLGSGHRVAATPLPLPAAFGGRRAAVLVVDPDTAVRRLSLTGASTITAVPVGLPPSSLACVADASGARNLVTSWVLPRDRSSLAAGDPLALVAGDRGDLLCAGFGRLPDDAAGCALPPVNAFDARLLVARRDGRALLAGLLDENVATVEALLDDGTAPAVPTTIEGPYRGRYAGRVRFVTLLLPAERRVVGARLRDAAGRLLNTVEGPEPWPWVVAPSRVLRSVGAPPLYASLQRTAMSPTPFACAGLGPPAATADAARCALPAGVVGAAARCDSRRIILYGLLPDWVREVEVALTGRRQVGAPTVALAPRLRPARRALLLALPRDAVPRSLVVRGPRRAIRRGLPLPAAGAQCGYAAAVDLSTANRAASASSPSGSATRSSHTSR